MIPQNAGTVLIFTPPGTPRRGSTTSGTASQDLSHPPKDGFGMVEVTIQSPFANGESGNVLEQSALKTMEDVIDDLVKTEEKYVDELGSLVQVGI